VSQDKVLKKLVQKNNESILIVDDDADLLSVLEDIIGEEYVVYKATSAKLGLEILSQKKIDCILTDYKMPEMNGLQFIDKVKESFSHIPIILITGNGQDRQVKSALTLGVFDYLDKPFQPEVLLNRIRHSMLLPRLEVLLFEMAKYEYPEISTKDYHAKSYLDKMKFIDGLETILKLRLQNKNIRKAQ
jgi:CheY-like chemotaxis protein